MKNDNGVLIGDRRAPWLRLVLHSGVIVIALASMTYLVTRLSATYTNRAQLVELQRDVGELRSRHDSEARDTDVRLSILEQTLFADVQPKLTAEQQKRRTMPAETWQANRDKELRERIRRLEEQVLVLRQQVPIR